MDHRWQVLTGLTAPTSSTRPPSGLNKVSTLAAGAHARARGRPRYHRRKGVADSVCLFKESLFSCELAKTRCEEVTAYGLRLVRLLGIQEQFRSTAGLASACILNIRFHYVNLKLRFHVPYMMRNEG